MAKLLTRDQFRNGVFQRDNHKCVVPGCGEKADDAHHIIERSVWQDEEAGGYYLENGASLCEPHHQYGAETCTIPPQALRAWAKITETILPKQLDPTKQYDKWGIPLKEPTRIPVKYPSTLHLIGSGARDDQDAYVEDIQFLLNKPLIFTEKMDGGNTTMTKEHIGARNARHADDSSFDNLKTQHAAIKHLIPEHIQIYGENLYHKHTIAYEGEKALENYFQIFAVYNQKTQLFLDWDSVETIAKKLGFPTVAILAKNETYKTTWELERRIHQLAEQLGKQGREGLVVKQMWPYHYAAHEGYTTTNCNDGTTWTVRAIAKYVNPWFTEAVNEAPDHWNKMKRTRNQLKTFNPK